MVRFIVENVQSQRTTLCWKQGLRLICWLCHRGAVASGRRLMELSRDPEIALQGMARISNQQEYIAADDAYLKLIDHP